MEAKKIKIFILLVNTNNLDVKLRFMRMFRGFLDKVKKLDELLIKSVGTAVKESVSILGSTVSGIGSLSSYTGDKLSNSKNGKLKKVGGFFKKVGKVTKEGGDAVKDKREIAGEKTVSGYKSFTKFMHDVAEKGGDKTVGAVQFFARKELNEKQEKLIKKIGKIGTHIAIPGAATAVGTMFILMGVDVDALEEAMENDPQVLEAMLMTHSELDTGSSTEEIMEKLKSYDEDQMKGYISNLKGKLGEITICDMLNDTSDDINYKIIGNNSSAFDIGGYDTEDNLVEKVEVVTSENLSYVKKEIASTEPDVTIYVNKELESVNFNRPNVKISEFKEQSLENRVIKFVSSVNSNAKA